jgi:antitoxin MazE
MTATVQKWGNSLALRIPSAVARQIRIESGDAVELKIDKNSLTIRPSRPRYRLADLVSRIRPGNRHAETDWGKSVGRES